MPKAPAGKALKGDKKSGVKKKDNPSRTSSHLRDQAHGERSKPEGDPKAPGSQGLKDHHDLPARDGGERDELCGSALGVLLYEQYKRKKDKYITRLESMMVEDLTAKELIAIMLASTEIMDSVVKSVRHIFGRSEPVPEESSVDNFTDAELDYQIKQLEERVKNFTEHSHVGNTASFEGTDGP